MSESTLPEVLERLVGQPDSGICREEFGWHCVYCDRRSSGDIERDARGQYTVTEPEHLHEKDCPILEARRLLQG